LFIGFLQLNAKKISDLKMRGLRCSRAVLSNKKHKKALTFVQKSIII
jgi:hypothetical protein